MLLRKTLHTTKKILNKTLQNFKSFIFGRYEKLSRAPSLKMFRANMNNQNKMQHLDNFYKQFCEQCDSNDDGGINQNVKVSQKQDLVSNTSMVKVSQGRDNEEEKDDVGCSIYVGSSRRSQINNVLERKMKELEMMDAKDEEHVLDVEEVLHYYSLLTSPIYQDLVDKFFTDMYSEFNVPRPPIRSNSLNSSIRRLGPLNI